MRRRIALGRKVPEYATQTWTYATSDSEWHPKKVEEPDESDWDLIRKQRIEDEIAYGE